MRDGPGRSTVGVLRPPARGRRPNTASAAEVPPTSVQTGRPAPRAPAGAPAGAVSCRARGHGFPPPSGAERGALRAAQPDPARRPAANGMLGSPPRGCSGTVAAAGEARPIACTWSWRCPWCSLHHYPPHNSHPLASASCRRRPVRVARWHQSASPACRPRPSRQRLPGRSTWTPRCSGKEAPVVRRSSAATPTAYDRTQVPSPCTSRRQHPAPVRAAGGAPPRALTATLR